MSPIIQVTDPVADDVTLQSAPQGVTTEDLLYTLVHQQAQLFNKLHDLDNRVTNIESTINTIQSDIDTIKGHTDQIQSDVNIIRDEVENTLSPETINIRANTDDIRHELVDLTVNPNAHTDDICINQNDTRNPSTLKDYTALIKQETRHMDDCERDCPDDSWAIELSLELSTTQDNDENGLIFGLENNSNGFIFDEDFELWPQILQQAFTRERYDNWTGPTLSFDDYESGLQSNDSCSLHRFQRWRNVTGY